MVQCGEQTTADHGQTVQPGPGDRGAVHHPPNYNRIVDIGWRGVVAAVIVILGAFVIGYALGSNRHRREVLGLGTAQRNISAATIVASQSFDEPEALVMVIATSLIGLAVLFPIAHLLRRREPGQPASTADNGEA